MKKHIWKRGGNRVVIDTGNKTFDRQCDGFHTGNVIGTVQLSSYIRPKNETECNGYQFAIGHLRTTDINSFRFLPHFVRNKVEELTETQSAILYEIRHFISDGRGGHKKIIHGYILTRGYAHNYKFLYQFHIANNYKSNNILEIAKEYICNY